MISQGVLGNLGWISSTPQVMCRPTHKHPPLHPAALPPGLLLDVRGRGRPGVGQGLYVRGAGLLRLRKQEPRGPRILLVNLVNWILSIFYPKLQKLGSNSMIEHPISR